MKTDKLNIRVRPDHKSAFEKAAKTAGLNLSQWTIDRLIKALKREIGWKDEKR